MLSSTRAFSTVECLVALVVFALGGLGSVATVALAIRATAEGNAAATGARLATAALDSLRGEVTAAGQRCAGVAAGEVAGRHGTRARWRLMLVTGGQRVELTALYPTVRGPRSDTLTGFIPCR